MRALFFFATLLLFGPASTEATDAPSPTPTVYILNGEVLRLAKGRIDSKDNTLLPAYKKLLKDADKALTEGPFTVMDKKNSPPSGDKHDYMSLAPYFWPDPSKKDGLPYLRKDGQTNPEVKDYKDKEYLPKLSELIQTLSLAYYFSADERYAAHAAKLLEVWFLNADTKMNPNMNFSQAIKGVNTGRGAGLIDARNFLRIIDGAGLLQGSKSWTAADGKRLQAWFADFLTWMQTSPIGTDELDAPNNHGTYYDVLRLTIALFTENKAAAKDIVTNITKRLDSQMDAEGKFPLEMQRTIALHYNVFDLHAFFMAASMAEKTGFDLWHYVSPSGASLKKGFDYFHPYLTKQKEWTGQQIKPFDFDEGYPVLLMAEKKLGCKGCKEEVRTLAGSDAEKRREWLMY